MCQYVFPLAGSCQFVEMERAYGCFTRATIRAIYDTDLSRVCERHREGNAWSDGTERVHIVAYSCVHLTFVQPFARHRTYAQPLANLRPRASILQGATTINDLEDSSSKLCVLTRIVDVRKCADADRKLQNVIFHRVCMVVFVATCFHPTLAHGVHGHVLIRNRLHTMKVSSNRCIEPTGGWTDACAVGRASGRKTMNIYSAKYLITCLVITNCRMIRNLVYIPRRSASKCKCIVGLLGSSIHNVRRSSSKFVVVRCNEAGTIDCEDKAK